MSRVKRGLTAHARHKKILDMAKGYRGRNKNVFRVAVEKVEKGLQYAYRDRRAKKRSFRSLWIQRINAATRIHDMTYSRFISGLIKAGVELDRKVLADIALKEPQAFAKLVETAKANGLNMYHYLWYLLEELPQTDLSEEAFEKYLPWNPEVKTALEEKAQKLLED